MYDMAKKQAWTVISMKRLEDHLRVRQVRSKGPGENSAEGQVASEEGRGTSYLKPETCATPGDTSTAVNDKDYQVPFRFNGKIAKLTFDLGPMQLSESDQKVIREARARAGD